MSKVGNQLHFQRMVQRDHRGLNDHKDAVLVDVLFDCVLVDDGYLPCRVRTSSLYLSQESKYD